MENHYPKFRNYKQLLKELHSDALIKEYIACVRWNGSPRCIHCDSPEFVRSYSKPGFYDCSSCKIQFSVLQGTIFERSPIPLDTWLWALFEFCVQTLSSIKSAERHTVEQKTAWRMNMRIRQTLWMEMENKLSGKIYCDEKELGPDPQKDLRVYHDKRQRDKQGLSPNHYMNIFGMLEEGKAQKATKKKPAVPGGRLLLFLVEDIGLETLQTKMVVNSDSMKSEFITDGWPGYYGFNYWCRRHFILNKSKFGKYDFRKYVRKVNPFTLELANEKELSEGNYITLHNNNIETVWSHLQKEYERYFGYSKEYAQMYLNEFMFHWNHQHLSKGEKFHVLLERALSTPLYEGKGKDRKKVVLESKFTWKPKSGNSSRCEWKRRK